MTATTYEPLWKHLRSQLYPLRRWVAWIRQGRPHDEPVVMRVGRLIACRHGFLLVDYWHWDLHYLTYQEHPDDDYRTWDQGRTWERYTARYPVERVPTLDCCPSCEASARR